MKHHSTSLLNKKTLPLVVVAALLLAQAVALVAPFRAQAAPTMSGVVVTGTMTPSLNPTGTKTVTNYNAGTGSGRVLVVVVASDDRTNRMSSVTYGGVSMTQRVSQLVGGTAQGRVQIYTLSGSNLPSGINSFQFTATTADNYAYVISYVTGADTNTPVGTTNTNSASTGSSLSVSNVPTESDSLIIAGFASDSTTAFTPASGSSEIGEVSVGTGGVRAGFYTKVAPTSGVSTTVGASGGNAAWAAGSVEIKLPLPVAELTATASDQSATEPPAGDEATDTGEFTVSRLDEGVNAVDFNFDLDGTAYSYNDYSIDVGASTCQNVEGDRATLPANVESCTIVIAPNGDEDENEETEYVLLQLYPGEDYDVSGDDPYIYIENYIPPDLGGTDAYSVAEPGYETMSIYDDDIVPTGSVAGFVATPARVQPGQTATLSWSVLGMTSCSINNGIGAVDATDGPHTATTGAITARTTFVLSCTDAATTHEYTAVVGIVPSFIEQ